MDQEERGFREDGVRVGFGPPEVDGGLGINVEGLGGEAGGGERIAEEFAVYGDETQAGGNHFLGSLYVIRH